MTISNTPTETYQISISQRYTRHSSRNLYYSTTPAVTIPNSRAETYQISISQRLTRYVKRYLNYDTACAVNISNTRVKIHTYYNASLNQYMFLCEYLK